MSFYTQDDGSDSDNGLPSSNNPNQIICPICGSNDFHKKDGVMTCSSCFTQSQTQNIDEVVDEDDFAHIIGEDSGRIRSAKRLAKGKRSMSYYDHRKPLPTLDDCIEATQYLLKHIMIKEISILAGVQEKDMSREVRSLWFGYLKAWAAGAEEYASLLEDQDTPCPLPRFSLRDSYLGPNRTLRIITYLQKKHNLSLRGGNQNDISKENEQKNSNADRSSMKSKFSDSSSTSSGSSSDSDSSALSSIDEYNNSDKNATNDTDLDPITPYLERKQSKHKFYMKKPIPSINHALNTTKAVKKKQIITRLEAALRAPPSMTLFVSILHRSLFHLRAGVAASHIRHWILNGSLSYMNSYDKLSPSLQARVQSIQRFFRPHLIPKVSHIEHFSELIWMASGLDTKINRESPQKLERMAIRHKRGMVDNGPLMAARFVEELGLNQRVLDLVFALMGIPSSSFGKYDKTDNTNEANSKKKSMLKKESEDNGYGTKSKGDVEAKVGKEATENSHDTSWLPPPLRLGQIKNITHPIQILGLIVVACKMCPDWKTWSYKHPSLIKMYESISNLQSSITQPITKLQTQQSQSSNSQSQVSFSLSQISYENGKTSPLKQSKQSSSILRNRQSFNIISNALYEQYIPYQESGLKHITNGSSLECYIGFAKDVLCKRHESKKDFQNILNWIEKENIKRQHQHAQTSGKNELSYEQVLPHPIIAQPPPPPLPEDPLNHKTSTDLKQMLDSNPNILQGNLEMIQKLQIYEVTDCKLGSIWHNIATSSGTSKSGAASYFPHDSIRPSYGLLVEYISDKCGVPPTILNEMVLRFELELCEMGTCAYSQNSEQNHVHNVYRKRNRNRMKRKRAKLSPFETHELMKIQAYHQKRRRKILSNDHVSLKKNYTYKEEYLHTDDDEDSATKREE